MAKKHMTSWDGEKTKIIQAGLDSKSYYTRYKDRVNRSGLEVVKPTDTHLEIYQPVIKGQKLVGLRFLRREFKYNNFSGDDPNAKKTFKNRYQKAKTKLQKKPGRSVKFRSPRKLKRKV